MNKIKELFSKYSTAIFYAVFVISFIIRVHEFGIFKDFNSDKGRQLHGTNSMLHGQGLNYISYDLNTFQPLQHPVVDWPPGYPYIIAGITKVFGSDIYTSSLYLDYFIEVLLWLTLLWLCTMAGLSNWQKILFFVFLGCSKTLLQPIWSSDAAGTTLFLVSCGLNMWYVRKTDGGQKTTILFFAAQFVLMCTALMLKYSLLPTLFSTALSIGAYYFHSKNKNYLKAAGVLVILAVVCLGLLWAYNRAMSGLNTSLEHYHPDDGKLIHLYNLRYFYPFILDSLFYIGPFSSRLDSNMVNNTAAIITVILLIWIVTVLYKSIKDKKAGFFEYLTLLTMVFVTGFLVLLSLKFKANEMSGGVRWTYVKEFRYYLPAIFLMLIYLFKTKSALRYIVLPAVLYTSMFWAYYTYIGNRANSFEALYGRVFKVSDDVKKLADENTYFMSYTGEGMFDAQLTSRVAIENIKVAMSYYEYFPDSTFKTPFTATQIPQGKKLIIYLGQNTKMLDSVNAVNKYTVDTTSEGGSLLVINN